MRLQPKIEFPSTPDTARLKDQLWVDLRDLERMDEDGEPWVKRNHWGAPFTGCAVQMDAQGQVVELWEYVNGTQQGWVLQYSPSGQWLTCQESLVGVAHGAGWRWDEQAGYVCQRWHSHMGAQVLVQELDRFGAILSEEWLSPPAPVRLEDAPYRLLANLAAVDVCYRDDGTAHAACVIFTSPEHVLGEQVLATVEVDVAQVAPYEPGAFFKRELPCILAVLAEARHMIDMVVVDGYVFLEQDAPGLGAKLHETLEGSVAVMGVAKTSFHGGQAVEVLRGASGTPLYVGAVGLDPQAAASLVLKMKGSHRLPDALRRADALSRGNQFQPS